MSEFSEKCKELIQKTETNISQISKVSSLDRTTLQKMVQGKKLPGIKFFLSFCECLSVSASEKAKLEELFHIEKIGREQYEQRKAIEKMIREFATITENLTEKNLTSVDIYPERDRNDAKEDKVKQLKMDLNIIDAIRYITISAFSSSDEVHIYMDDFMESYYVMQQLVQKTGDVKAASIYCHQLVRITKKATGGRSAKENIDKMRNVFPFALVFKGTYDVRCSYETINEEYLKNVLWPHYIITADKVLLLSADCKKGLLIENPEVAEGYFAEAKKIHEEYKPMFSYIGNDAGAMEYYANHVAKRSNWVCAFETTPCVLKLGERIVMDPQYDGIEIIENYRKQYETQRENMNDTKNYRLIYGFHGMESFIRTGRFPGIQGSYFAPVSEAMRREMIQDYCKSMETRNNEYLLKKDVDLEGSGLNFELFDSEEVFIAETYGDKYFGCVCLDEPGLYYAFLDYFDSLIAEEKTFQSKESRDEFERRCNAIWKKIEAEK